METKEKEKIIIPPKAKIKVYWDDRPENYSRESKLRVRQYFSKKYGVPTSNIDVIYRPYKVNESGDVIKLDGATIDNVMDVNYQRCLFKEWLEREGKEVDFERLIKLDEKINNNINFNGDNIERVYKLKWLYVDNFLSFGGDNYFDVDKYNGFILINSVPPNQGGKTSLIIDAVKFLFFGETTKTTKNEEVFNKFSNKNEVIVKGCLDIPLMGEYVIERVLKRSKKRDGGWNVKGKVNYYRLLPNGEEEILNDEDSLKTGEVIKNYIGESKYFDLISVATSKNLDQLIDTTSGECGKILTKFIGLEVLSIKESEARGLYNEFSRKMKSNHYDIDTLTSEIEDNRKNIKEFNIKKDKLNNELLKSDDELKKLNDIKLELISSKIKIDDNILTLNPKKLKSEIDGITQQGIELKNKLKLINNEIDDIKDICFDEDRYYVLTKNKNKLLLDINVIEFKINEHNKTIDDLIKGGYCPYCKSKLNDVDNTEHINEHKESVKKLEKDKKVKDIELLKINEELSKLDEVKTIVDKRNKMELNRDKIIVDMDLLRVKLKEKKNDLKNYEKNVESIEFNKNIDIKLEKINTDINVVENKINKIKDEIKEIEFEIRNMEDVIDNNIKLINTIKKEREIEKIFKVYIEMVGKNGISKIILRSVLPIINSELQRLLEDIVDFGLEVYINPKNEVKILIIKDGVENNIKSGSGYELTVSSMALRCVLGKVSRLPKPNFIVFDEVIGRVASDNLPKLKPFIERISDMYDTVFFITQNDLFKDWSDKIITIIKENNISRISVK